MGKKQKKQKISSSNDYDDNIKFVKDIYERLKPYNITEETIKKNAEKAMKKEEDEDFIVDENLDDSCLVCYRKFSIKNKIKLKCGHDLCIKCYGKWKRIKNACPLCRKEITSVQSKSYDKYTIASLTQDDIHNLLYMFPKSY